LESNLIVPVYAGRNINSAVGSSVVDLLEWQVGKSSPSLIDFSF
jgi:hypothetical protein